MTEFLHILSYISSSKIRDRDPLVYLHSFKGLNPAVKSCGLLKLKQRTNNSKKTSGRCRSGIKHPKGESKLVKEM